MSSVLHRTKVSQNDGKSATTLTTPLANPKLLNVASNRNCNLYVCKWTTTLLDTIWITMVCKTYKVHHSFGWSLDRGSYRQLLFYTFCVLLFLDIFTKTVVAEIQPQLEIQPKGPQVIKAIGQSLALTCKPNVQDPNLVTQLEWRDTRNRRIDNTNPDSVYYIQKLSGEPGAVLIFTKLSENLAGTYSCVANYAASQQIKATIDVNTIVDITWVDAPESQYPVLGKKYKIRCEVQANPAPVVDWFRNGMPITSDDKYIVESKGLLINNVKESDDGVYTCRAVVAATGQLDTRNIKVEVQIPPKVQPMQDIEIVEGEQATVQCNAIGKPPPTYTWIKENTREDLSIADRFTVKKNTGLLLVTRAEYIDNSFYQCIAENPAGRDKTLVKINVLVKPNIYELINITAPIKTDTKIICKASGRPPPRVTFRKLNDKEPYVVGRQKNNSRIILEQEVNEAKGETFGILTFSNLNRTDDGLYECIAENKVGKSYKNGHIAVEFPPTFERTKDLPPVWTWDNRPANLSCIAESIPNATIVWRVNNIIIENSLPNLKKVGNGPQSFLIVHPGNEFRFFTKYECIATNKLGESRTFIELKQATVPLPIQQVKIESITATTIKFQIVGPANLHGLPLRAFVVQYQTERERNWDTARNHSWTYDAPYILENLEPQESYRFRFAARNDVGLGGWAGNQQITMPRRSVPAEPKILVSSNVIINKESNDVPQDLITNSPYANHFELRWNVPNDNGDPIDSYLIRYCVTHKVNGQWRDSEADCSEEKTQSFQYTNYQLNNLQPDTTYKIELRAHNAIGSSSPAQIRVKTAIGKDTTVRPKEASISSATIIGVVVAAVILVLVLVDLLCCCVNRAGILALICDHIRSKPVDEEDPKLGRDEKEPLNDNRGHAQIMNGERCNMTVEFDGKQVYSKPGEYIGKHSAV